MSTRGYPMVIRKGALLEGTFLTRPNRFLAMVQIGGQEVAAHVPDPGRLKELLIPGRRVYLERKHGKNRKTAYDLVLVDMEGTLVSVDSTLPNDIVADALKRGFFPEFLKYPSFRREAQYGKSRLDFRLTDDKDGDAFIEVKSASLVREGLALFPDAPTSRGARHLHELIDIQKKGHGAWVIFVIQREDAFKFSPNEEVDPAFAQALRMALDEGVGAIAYKCSVALDRICLKERVPILI